jgi:hypothetical protein
MNRIELIRPAQFHRPEKFFCVRAAALPIDRGRRAIESRSSSWFQFAPFD